MCRTQGMANIAKQTLASTRVVFDNALEQAEMAIVAYKEADYAVKHNGAKQSTVDSVYEKLLATQDNCQKARMAWEKDTHKIRATHSGWEHGSVHCLDCGIQSRTTVPTMVFGDPVIVGAVIVHDCHDCRSELAVVDALDGGCPE